MLKFSLLYFALLGCSAEGAFEASTEAPRAIYNASEQSGRSEVARDATGALQVNLAAPNKHSLAKCQVDYLWIGGCLLINTYCTSNGIDYDVINQELKCPPVFLMPKVKYSDPPIER